MTNNFFFVMTFARKISHTGDKACCNFCNQMKMYSHRRSVTAIISTTSPRAFAGYPSCHPAIRVRRPRLCDQPPSCLGTALDERPYRHCQWKQGTYLIFNTLPVWRTYLKETTLSFLKAGIIFVATVTSFWLPTKIWLCLLAFWYPTHKLSSNVYNNHV